MTQQEPRRGPARSGRLRVALVDDHEVIAAAVREALWHAPDLVLVASAPTVDALLALDAGPMHLVVLDLRLGDGSSPQRNVAQLTAAGCQVVALTSGEDAFLLRAAARTPVLGILRKSEPVRTITAALIRAAHGSPVITPEWAAAVQNDPLIADARLTAQEQRVLAQFADGNSGPMIATDIGIALSTVEDYIRRIRTKYARAGRPAATKVDLYKRAVEDGFLPGPNHP